MKRLALRTTLFVALGLVILLSLAILLGYGGDSSRTAYAQGGGTTRYVSSVSGSDSGDCTDGANPCRSIQYAVGQAGAGDTILVAAFEVTGSLTPPQLFTTTARYTGDGENVIEVTKSLTLKGGYILNRIGHTPTWIPWVIPSEVDGEHSRRVLCIRGDVTVTVEMLALVNGRAPYGGNVYVEDASVTFRATPVMSGTAYYDPSVQDSGLGGGVYLKNADVSFDPGDLEWTSLLSAVDLLPVQGNSAERKGGGIYVEGGSPALSGLAVISNTAAQDGGGIYVSGGSPILIGGTVAENQAGDRGGGFYLDHTSARIAGMFIYSNTATGDGAGVFVDGPLALSPESIPVIANSYIRHNVSSQGAGGGIYFREAMAGLINDIVADNEAGQGAGMYLWGSSPLFLHNTVAANVGDDGIHVTHKPGSLVPPSLPLPSQPSFTNTIVASHTVGIYVDSTGIPLYENGVRMEGTLWWANGTNIGGHPELVLTEADVTGDPRFTCTGDFPTCLNPYHLITDSAAVDSGVVVTLPYPLVDIDWELRPSGKGYDIGADEVISYDYSVWIVPPVSAAVVTPGQVVTHVHWLLNSGTQTDTYSLTLDSSAGWASLVGPAVITLTPQTSTTLLVRVEVPPSATEGMSDTSIVTAVSANDPSQWAMALDATGVLSRTFTDFSVSKWANVTQTLPGEEVLFTVTVTDNGPYTGSLQALITDTVIPSQAVGSLGLPAGCSPMASGVFTCSVSFPEGARPISRTLSFSLSVTDDYAGVLANKVEVGSEVVDPFPANNLDLVTLGAIGPDISIDKWAHVREITPGGTVSFTVVITGEGLISGSISITVTDFITPPEAASRVKPPPNCTGTVTTGITCTLSLPGVILPVTREFVFTFTVPITYVGPFTNQVSVTSDKPDPVTANNLAVASLEVKAAPPFKLYLPLVLKG